MNKTLSLALTHREPHHPVALFNVRHVAAQLHHFAQARSISIVQRRATWLCPARRQRQFRSQRPAVLRQKVRDEFEL